MRSGQSSDFTADIVQGIITVGVLAFISFQIIAHAYVTKVNGWTTMFGCGEPGNGILLRAACANEFTGTKTYRKRRCTGRRQ
jgi:hypothetical protein